MNKRIAVIFLIAIMIVAVGGLISALDEMKSYKQNEVINITQGCGDATYVTIYISFPNSSSALEPVNMTSVGSGKYFYEFDRTSVLGRYDVGGVSDGCTRTFSTYFKVTHSGGSLDEGASGILIMAIIFMLIVGGLCLFGFFRTEQSFQTKWTLFIMSFIFFLAGANIISTLIGDTLANPRVISFFDSFMAISFILFWFAFGLLAIMWILTLIYTALYRKKEKEMKKYGSF